jgi:hypothetical protein
MREEKNTPNQKSDDKVKIEDEVKEKPQTQFESNPQSQPETSNIESQTTNMEVHKHPHHQLKN